MDDLGWTYLEMNYWDEPEQGAPETCLCPQCGKLMLQHAAGALCQECGYMVSREAGEGS